MTGGELGQSSLSTAVAMKLTLAWKPLSSAWAQQSRRCCVNSRGFALRCYVSDMVLRFRVAVRTLLRPRGGGRTAAAVRRGPLSHQLQRWTRQSRAADLRRQAARQLFAGARLPLMGLTGVCLVNRPSVLTREEELESICVALRELALAGNQERVVAELPDRERLGLHDLELGALLGHGANAVVYSGRWRKAEDISTTLDICTGLNEGTELRGKLTERDGLAPAPKPGVQDPLEVRPVEEVGGRPFDLAVKVLFNYYAASNAMAIWDSLQKECLPVLVNQLLPAGSRWCCRLPPHPHLVEMWVAFADAVSLLPGATLLWPSALSPRLHPRGCGRNATLYLVMRRYECSLPEYLRCFARAVSGDPRVRLSLLCQLLEALCHLAQHGVAHRDLKADNCLLDLSRGVHCPRLVLCDFGSSLGNMRLHFTSTEVSRGGNPALMAPEVAAAEPGLLSVLDYSRADLWAAATLAYELYGAPNPFHDGDRDSRTYREAELPPPPRSMPSVVQALVRDMLRRDPAQRPRPAVAATVCQMLLLAPPDLLLLRRGRAEDARWVLRWLCSLMASCWPHWKRSPSTQPLVEEAPHSTLKRVPEKEEEALILAKMSPDVCSDPGPQWPMSLELARVLLSRVSLSHALEALHYIRVHCSGEV